MPRRSVRRHIKPVQDDIEAEVRVIIPENQIKSLTEQQLDEEKTIALDASNPNLPDKLVVYHCGKGEYVDDERELSHLIVHFDLESQINFLVDELEEIEPPVEAEDENNEIENEVEEEEEEVPAEKDGQQEAENDSKPKLRNQFKYSERGCQTFNRPTRDRGVSTVPPETDEFCSQVTRWQIHDAYVSEYLIKMASMENKGKKNDSEKFTEAPSTWKKETPSSLRLLHSDEVQNMAKQMEYVVGHNAASDVYQDLEFWKGDPKKPELNHLWRIKSQQRLCVTSIIFNERFTNMFAVGMGSYEFSRPKHGCVSVYTLKNPNTPEFSIATQSGVMCMNFSKEHPALLCVGFYNGSVAIYDIRQVSKPCLYEVTDPELQHKEPVWEVRWMPDEDMSFISISSDGAMVKWTLNKNELNRETLKIMKRSDSCNDKDGLLRIAQATTFDVNPSKCHQYLVGTEFGEIFGYDIYNNSEIPTEYQGHTMHVYAVRWSPFNDSTFLSCSEDWTVKLWREDQHYPIMVYDLVAPVGDVCWSRYSSTLFSATTYDNKIHVFDISVNKNDASIHHSTNSKKYSMTCVAMTADCPLVLAGNKLGTIDCLKIPEHLSKFSDTREEEQERLKQVLDITGTNVLDLKQLKLPVEILEP